MPFKAPRKISTDKDSINTSEVPAITDTDNATELEARQDKNVFVLPYPKGIKLMSEREANEEARYGEVLTWSPDIEPEQTIEKTPPQLRRHHLQPPPQGPLYKKSAKPSPYFFGRPVRRYFISFCLALDRKSVV